MIFVFEFCQWNVPTVLVDLLFLESIKLMCTALKAYFSLLTAHFMSEK